MLVQHPHGARQDALHRVQRMQLRPVSDAMAQIVFKNYFRSLNSGGKLKYAHPVSRP